MNGKNVREQKRNSTVYTFKRKQTSPNVTLPIISKRGSVLISNSNTFAKRQC